MSLPQDFLLANYINVYRNLNVSSTGSVIKALPGRIESVILCNPSAAGVYYRIYNKATAPASTDTPVFTIYVPTVTTLHMDISDPWTFSLGIGIRATTLVADNDTTSPATNGAVCNVTYK